MGGIRLAAYTEESCPGLVLHRCLCPCACTCAWKIPTPDFSITEPAAQEDRFCPTARDFPFGSHTACPQSTYVLLPAHCSLTHSCVKLSYLVTAGLQKEDMAFGQRFEFFLGWKNSQQTKIVFLLTFFVLSTWMSHK